MVSGSAFQISGVAIQPGYGPEAASVERIAISHSMDGYRWLDKENENANEKDFQGPTEGLLPDMVHFKTPFVSR